MRPGFRVLLLTAVSSLAVSSTATAAPPRPAGTIYERDIRPVLVARCGRCHADGERKGELDLGTLAGIRAGSESGAIVVPGKPSQSLLVEVLGESAMPPDGKNPPTKAEIVRITRWIKGGARTLAGAFDAGVTITQDNVLPILFTRCVVCHGLREQKGGLDLRTRASILKGGKSGPAIVPGKPDESLLVKRITAVEMPPPRLLVDFGIRTVEPGELETIRRWIAAGAPQVSVPPDIATSTPDPLVSDADRKFWSFQAPRRPPVPRLGGEPRIANPIDAFLLERLHARGLDYGPQAGRLTLVRRVAFDLTGLPPSWASVEAYLADSRPGAYERMVEGFLASHRYGERWGRYWLDLAGYADSEGKRSADPVRPHAWRYRDYVVRAFNADKPYDRFLLEQLAGDELLDYAAAKTITPELMDNLVATGFLRMAPDGTGSDIVNTVVERFEVVIDEIDVLGSAVLGLTLKCAQCHSHKYDPIPQRDYYRMVAVFQGAYDVYDWLKPSFVPGQTKSKAVGRVLKHVTSEQTSRFEQFRDAINGQIAAEQQKLKRAQQGLKKKDPAFKKLATDTAARVKELKARVPPQPQIRALWDRGEPSPTWLFRRGQYNKPGHLVGPGVPSVLTDGKTPFAVRSPWPGARQTGRRLALARWLIDADHPLTSRVLVNRVWYHHFGRGLVETLSNFGKTGTRPSHPELLDWLARELVARGWSLKEMHRLMINTVAYRQVSTIQPAADRIDPDNLLLWRMPLKRMEAEVIRDSILAVSGRLHDVPYGSPDPVDVRADGLVTSRGGPGGWRRSLYIQHRRKHVPTILETFDLPQMIPNCVERPDSTVASQALHLMNDNLIRTLADAFAERVVREVGNQPYQQIERVYQLALSRPPTLEERQLGQEVLAALKEQWRKEAGKTPPSGKAPSGNQPLATYCHTIINSAAFLFVD